MYYEGARGKERPQIGGFTIRTEGKKKKKTLKCINE
jgi:hypothetical protein